MIEIGKKAPDFTLPDEDKNRVSLSGMKGKWLVLYFYPRDNTPGCTVEANEFTALMPEFKKLNSAVFGISPDSCQSHKKFIFKLDLGVKLLADPERKVLAAYEAWGEKKLYGKISLGVIRSTVLIDPEGVVRFIWPKVKAKGHAEMVLEKIQQLQR